MKESAVNEALTCVCKAKCILQSVCSEEQLNQALDLLQKAEDILTEKGQTS